MCKCNEKSDFDSSNEHDLYYPGKSQVSLLDGVLLHVFTSRCHWQVTWTILLFLGDICCCNILTVI